MRVMNIESFDFAPFDCAPFDRLPSIALRAGRTGIEQGISNDEVRFFTSLRSVQNDDG